MWQAFELAMAKEFRPLMYLRVIGPYDRLRPGDEVLAAARRGGPLHARADLSVLPRVAMYALVQVPLDGGRHPNVARWVDTVGRRPSVVQSEEVRPADGA